MLSAVCSGCNTEITGQVMSAYERLYHPACFVCAQCLQPIHAGETFALRGNDLYCKKDYDRVLAAGLVSKSESKVEEDREPYTPKLQRVQTSADPFSQPQHRVAPQGTLSPNHLLHTDMERGLHRGQSMPNLVLPDEATSMPCADLRDGAWLDPPMAPAPTSSTDHLQATVKAEQVPLLLQPIGLKRSTSTPQLPGPPPGPIYSGSVDSPKIRRGSNLKLRPSPYNVGGLHGLKGMSPMLHSISLMDLGGPATSDFDFDRLTTELLQECLGHNMQ